MSTPALTRLIYASRATSRVLTNLDQTVADVLATAQRKNALGNVTGMLLVHEGWFVQALEGSPLAVEAVFKRVSKDPRHGEVKIIANEAAEQRQFAQWAMCAKTLSAADSQILEVLSMRTEFNPHRASPQAALRLLTTIGAVHSRAA